MRCGNPEKRRAISHSPELPGESQESGRETREDAAERLHTEPLDQKLADHVAVVGRAGEVAGVERRRLQPRPAAVHLAADDAAAEQQHLLAVAVVDPAAAVLL